MLASTEYGSTWSCRLGVFVRSNGSLTIRVATCWLPLSVGQHGPVMVGLCPTNGRLVIRAAACSLPLSVTRHGSAALGSLSKRTAAWRPELRRACFRSAWLDMVVPCWGCCHRDRSLVTRNRSLTIRATACLLSLIRRSCRVRGSRATDPQPDDPGALRLSSLKHSPAALGSPAQENRSPSTQANSLLAVAESQSGCVVIARPGRTAARTTRGHPAPARCRRYSSCVPRLLHAASLSLIRMGWKSRPPHTVQPIDLGGGCATGVVAGGDGFGGLWITRR